MAHPALEPLSDLERQRALEAFVAFMTEPAFGSWSKREIELKLFELLYARRLHAVSVGDVAAELTMTRARARGLLLEARTRRFRDPAERTRALRDLLVRWPRDAEVERDGDRLRLVIDDPFLRDLVKNHAYANRLLLDTSFASEIVSLRWSDYAKLLASVVSDEEARILERDLGAAVRKKLAADERLRSEFERNLARWNADRSRAAHRAERAVTFARDYALPVTNLAAVVPRVLGMS